MNTTSVFDWKTYDPQESAVLCFIQQDERVLLIEKKRGLGAGKINGPGGRLEPGESFVDAAIRETQEEVCVIPEEPEWRASLDFAFTNGYHLHVRVFVAASYVGTAAETDEAVPLWPQAGAIPFDRMWEDDRLWLPMVLGGTPVAGRFYFDDDTMLTSDLQLGVREFNTGSEDPE